MIATLVAAVVADLGVNQQEHNSEDDYIIMDDLAVNQQERSSEDEYDDDLDVNQQERDSEDEYDEDLAVNQQERSSEDEYDEDDDLAVNQQERNSEDDYLVDLEVNLQERFSYPTTETPVEFCNVLCNGSRYVTRCNIRCLYTIRIKDVCFPIYEDGETNHGLIVSGIKKCKYRMQKTLVGANSFFRKCMKPCRNNRVVCANKCYEGLMTDW